MSMERVNSGGMLGSYAVWMMLLTRGVLLAAWVRGGAWGLMGLSGVIAMWRA